MPETTALPTASRSVRGRLGEWLFQTNHPARNEVTLGQRQIFILPSRTGLLFGLVLIVMYLGAINYSLGLGHALVFLLAALGLTAMVHSFRNLVGLQISSGGTTPVHAGETVHFRVLANNLRNEHRPALRLQFKGEDAVLADLHSESTQTITIPCRSRQRGWLTPPRLTLSSVFPLGLFYAWSYPPLSFRCLIYPALIVRPLPPPLAGDRPGNIGTDSGDDDFAGFRNRQPGDPPKHIAWKTYARDPSDRPLLVKHFSGSGEPELCLNWHMIDADFDTETRLSILAGWVVQARDQGRCFTLQLPRQHFASGSGDVHAARCLEALAEHGQSEH